MGMPDMTMTGNELIDGRQSLVRFRLGGSLEFILTEKWNLWASFEGVFGNSRRVLGDIFNAGNEDLELYARLGFTFKFGY